MSVTAADVITFLRQRVAILAREQPRTLSGQDARDRAIDELRRAIQQLHHEGD